MTQAPKSRGLGRGLDALFGDIKPVSPMGADVGPDYGFRSLPLEWIEPNRDQPRKAFEDQALQELAESIRAHGVLQPIIVRPHPDRPQHYQIVAGERRWRAAQRAQIYEIPALIQPLTDKTVLELALVENVQRVDLAPMEEARAYQFLLDSGYTQERVDNAVSKSRTHVANMIRLLSAPAKVQIALAEGRITIGHARALLAIEEADQWVDRIADEGWTVRDVEDLNRARRPGAPNRRGKPVKDVDTVALEADLAAGLGMEVEIRHRANGGGELRIAYGDLEQLDHLCRILAGRAP